MKSRGRSQGAFLHGKFKGLRNWKMGRLRDLDISSQGCRMINEIWPPFGFCKKVTTPMANLKNEFSWSKTRNLLPDSLRVVEYNLFLIINNRVGGNAPLIAQMVVDKFHRERQPRMLQGNRFFGDLF